MTLSPLLTQLGDGASTAGVDCAVLTILNGARWASGGRVGPHTHAQLPSWVHAVRNAAHNWSTGLLMEHDALEVYNSAWFHDEFHKHGLTPPRVTYKHDYGYGSFLDRLRGHQYAHLCVDYGVLNDGHAPTGSLSFRGDHSVAVVDPYKHGRYLYAHIGDPLCDGRTRWVNGRWFQYPQGWQGTRLFEYRDAAGRWGDSPPGPGRLTAIFLERR